MMRWMLLLASTILLPFSTVVAQNAAEIVAEVDGDRISSQDLKGASGALLARLEGQA